MTFSLSERSLTNLNGVHPALLRVEQLAITMSTTDWGVPEKATRTPAEQAMKVAGGFSKTMHSNHLVRPDGFGHAVDNVPWVDGQFTWQHSDPFYEIARAMRLASITLSTPLVWGGVWDRQLATLGSDTAGLRAAVAEYNSRHPGPDFNDLPHFELAPGVTE